LGFPGATGNLGQAYRIRQGEHHMETTALPRMAGRPDFTAMLVSNGLRDG